jgi:hypothetical protein
MVYTAVLYIMLFLKDGALYHSLVRKEYLIYSNYIIYSLHHNSIVLILISWCADILDQYQMLWSNLD